MVRPEIHRFEVWIVQLDPTHGSEIRKTRPCVVISPDEMSSLKTVIVAPLTSKGFQYPSRIPCVFQGKNGLVLLDQIRAVDKSRLIHKLGNIKTREQVEIVNCLQEFFAF